MISREFWLRRGVGFFFLGGKWGSGGWGANELFGFFFVVFWFTVAWIRVYSVWRFVGV